MSEKICAVYKITNTITGDFYIGSSNDVKHRLACHKCPSRWKKYPNNPMYQDIQKYGVDKFVFQVIAEAEPNSLKEKEQEFIETLKPTYNQMNAKGLNVERQKEYEKTEKYKESCRKANRKYYKSHRESLKKANKKYDNQLCCYNGETLTLCALAARLRKAGIPHSTTEAKKYLI